MPRGPLFAALKRGETVVLPDGRSVTSDQVVEPAEPGAHFVIVGPVDPAAASFGRLTSDELLARYAEGGSLFGRLCLVVHLSRRSTLEREEYRQWMSSFGEAVQHVFLAQDEPSLSLTPFIAARLFRAKLRVVCPEVCSAVTPHRPGAEESGSPNILWGKCLLSFVLAPRRKQGLVAPTDVDTEAEVHEFRQSLSRNEEFNALLRTARFQRDSVFSAETLCPEDRLLMSEEGGFCFLGILNLVSYCSYLRRHRLRYPLQVSKRLGHAA